MLIGGVAQVGDVEETISWLKEIRNTNLVQIVDAEYVAGREHVELALLCTRRAFRGGYNISHDPSIEFLLCMAATRQIKDARKIGLKKGKCRVVIVVDSINQPANQETTQRLIQMIQQRLKLNRDDSLIQCSEWKW